MQQQSARTWAVARDSDGGPLLRTDSIVAPTGQEEVQYQVLTSPQFGLTDMQVRNWTNGPAFLTWSRGQNSHGNGIGGPLPRSFMRSQAQLQKQIMARCKHALCSPDLSCAPTFAASLTKVNCVQTASLGSLATCRPSVGMHRGLWPRRTTRPSQAPEPHEASAGTITIQPG